MSTANDARVEAQCPTTSILPGGQITIQGTIVNRSLNFTLPITGGSGRYQGAGGQVSADHPIEVVAIDIPIGLPDRSSRQADDLARAVVGRRWPSVFKTPVREALQAPDHVSAIAINHRLASGGVSAQAFALRSKLLQVDTWVRHTDLRVVEVHPEVSFAALAGAPLPHPKTTWAGATQRRYLLAQAGIEIPDDLGPAGSGAAVDDVLDAAAAAWTARRVAHGQARSMPDPPEVFSDGLLAAIWT